MLIEIKRNSHIKIREKNRLLTYIIVMHGLNFNEILETKENILRLSYIIGAKQEGLTIVHFLNRLIVSCKEAVRFPF